MIRRRLNQASLLWSLLATLLLPVFPAIGHNPGESYLNLKVDGLKVTGQIDVSLRDLETAVGLDADNNGSVTYDELLSRQPAIGEYALSRLKISADGVPADVQITSHEVSLHSDGVYAVIHFELADLRRLHVLEIEYRLFDFDSSHRGLMQLDYKDQQRVAVFSKGSAVQRFELEKYSRWQQFRDFVWEGVWHIWIGFDHILFLVALLLPAVLQRGQDGWQPVTAFRPAFWNVLKIVTAFTVAHSITLSLAALQILSLPPRLVESSIAGSVVLAAGNNLRPFFRERSWLVAFVFGLIHGFGFANVLGDLGLPKSALAATLVAFNVGVEAGQLAIVAIFLPAAFALRRTWFYHRLAFQGGSAAIILVAALWMTERVFDFEFMPF